jgi:hypothetical protein
MSTKTIKAGEVIILNSDALPIHRRSDYYVEGGRVIPDGSTWHKCLSLNGAFAMHNEDLHDYTIQAKDENGEDVRIIYRESSYVTAEDRRGYNKYFTSERAAENANFKFSFRLGRWHDAECPRFFGDEKLLNYHTQQSRIDRSKLPQYHTDSDEYLVGIEVEKTDYDLQQSGEAWKILTETGWSKESDSSLSSGGFELVSPILPLFNMRKIREASDKVADYINASSDDSCGGHITLSNKNKSGSDLLESFKHFAPILYSLYPKRLSNRFCMAKQWSKYFSYPEKYSAFYLKDSSIGGRVEIRLFSRIKDEDSMYWRLELLQLLLLDGGNLNQLAQKLGCQESVIYKHFAKHYTHTKIGDKLKLIDELSKKYGTHRNGISPSVKKRINNTMGYDVFEI